MRGGDVEATTLQALWNSLIVFFGASTLASPYALTISGYVGVLICTLMSILYCIGVLLMIQCLKSNPDNITNYNQIAGAAFARPGRLLTTILFYVETGCTLIGFLTVVGDLSAPALPENFHLHVNDRLFFTLLAMVIILPGSWFPDLSHISIFSFTCTLNIGLVMLCVLYVGLVKGLGRKLAFIRPDNIPKSIGIYSFGFGSSPVMPGIYSSMKKKSEFSLILFATFFIFNTLFLLFGLLGGSMFGTETGLLITSNLPRKFTAAMIARWSALLIPVCKFPLLLWAITSDLQQIVMKRYRIPPKSQKSTMIRIGLSSIIALMIMGVALLLPKSTGVFEFVGSSLDMILGVILPGAFYIKIFQSSLSRLQLISVGGFIALGVALGITGTIASVRDLI